VVLTKDGRVYHPISAGMPDVDVRPKLLPWVGKLVKMVERAPKAEIFALIDRLVAGGAAALMISSEQAEICHVCDRAYVMREGRIAGELARTELTEENIVRLGMHHG